MAALGCPGERSSRGSSVDPRTQELAGLRPAGQPRRLSPRSVAVHETAGYTILIAVSGVWKAILWLPSQKGLLAEAPQRQRENAVLPVRSYLLPSASTISITPLGSSMRKGPLLRTVIVTCAMKPPVKMSTVQTIAQSESLNH